MQKKELGQIVIDFPPVPEKKNPRNSEGAFLTCFDGTILFVYSKFKGNSQEDWGFTDIALVISKDDGKTFGEECVITTCEEEKAINIMSLSLLMMQNGDIGLFYLVRSTRSQLQMFLRRSADGGKSWGERILCMPQDGFFVVNNDRVVRLSNGRIFIPAAKHSAGMEYKKEGSQHYMDYRSEVVFFYSDDDGYTWNCSPDKCCMPFVTNCYSGLQEPGVIELQKGILWGFARTDLGRQYEMFSLNYGEKWTTVQPSRFTSPNSPLSMKRDKEGNIYAIWNPIPEYNGRERTTEIFTGGRTPLVIAVSRDNGETFSQPTAFETEDNRGYCYCAIHFTEEAMLLAYCAGGPEDGTCLARLRIRRIPFTELAEL